MRWWHWILAKICGQRISFQRRSRLNQCTSSISLHVGPASYYSMILYHYLSLIFMLFSATYPLFHTQKEIDSSAILLKKLHFSRSSDIQWWHAAGQVYFFMHDVAKMETSSQPTCALETLFGSVHLFCCNQGTMYDISECVVIASYCSSDTLWNASAKTIHYPCPRHSRCLVCDNHCMREPNIIKKNTCACRIRQGPLHCTYKYRSMFVSSLF